MIDIDSVFSPMQQEYLKAKDARINVLTGSVRSGKSHISLFKFAERIKYSPMDSLYMFTALTSNTLVRNVLSVLMGMVGEANLHYSIGNKDGWLFGHHILLEYAPDERAEQKIRGLTIDGAYCDELTLYRESFFKMLLSRLSKPNATLTATTNPDNPNHWLKTGYLDRAEELDCKVWEFRLEDNTFLDRKYIENIKKEYTGVFYRRFILGEWVLADGLVFSAFDEGSMLIDTPSLESLNGDYAEKYIGIDYGIENPTAFVLFAWHKTRRQWHIVRDYAYGGRDNIVPKTDDELYRDLLKFSEGIDDIKACIVDPSAKSFIVLMQRERSFKVLAADNDVIPGITFVNTLFSQGKLMVARGCTNLRRELFSYSWDTEKSRQTGKDTVLKVNDHNCDAMRYVCRTAIQPRTRLYGILLS